MTEVIGIIIDTETGGLDCKRDALLQVGAVAFGFERNPAFDTENSMFRLVEVDSFKVDILPNPKLTVCMEALKVQGVTPSFIWSENRTSEHEAYRQFMSWVLRVYNPERHSSRLMWAHNASFDSGFVKTWESRVSGETLPKAVHWSCSQNLTVALNSVGRLPDMGKTDFSSSLSSLCRRFGIETARDQTGHDALTDARLTLEVLNHLWKAAGWL